MHLMLRKILNPHRIESACTDMQGDLTPMRTAGFEGLNHGSIDVQTGRGCRHRTGVLGKDGLVPLAIRLGIGTLDIGG